MTAIVPLRMAAERFGIAPRYLQQIVADKLRPLDQRKYPLTTHERFPVFAKDTNGRWVISSDALERFIRSRVLRLEPPV